MARKSEKTQQQWERPNLVLRWVVFENVRGSAAGSFLVMDPSRETVLGMPESRAQIPTVNIAMTHDELCSALESMVYHVEKHVRLTSRANRVRERAWEALNRFSGRANGTIAAHHTTPHHTTPHH